MSAIQETDLKTKVKMETEAQPSVSIVTRFIQLLSSVRFGIILLILLAAACMIGMIIMQQSVEGFDKYFAELTPAQRLVYGSLGFFDIYHSWYFNFLLLTLSLNIVLASIDHFPGAWKYITKKKLGASRPYILKQKPHARFHRLLRIYKEIRRSVAGGKPVRKSLQKPGFFEEAGLLRSGYTRRATFKYACTCGAPRKWEQKVGPSTRQTSHTPSSSRSPVW